MLLLQTSPQKIIIQLHSSHQHLFSWFFCFCGLHLHCFSLFSQLSPTLSPGSCFQQKSSFKSTAHHLPSTKQHTDKVSNQLVNIMEHLAAKEPDISLRSYIELKREKTCTYIQTMKHEVLSALNLCRVAKKYFCCTQIAFRVKLATRQCVCTLWEAGENQRDVWFTHACGWL